MIAKSIYKKVPSVKNFRYLIFYKNSHVSSYLKKIYVEKAFSRAKSVHGIQIEELEWGALPKIGSRKISYALLCSIDYSKLSRLDKMFIKELSGKVQQINIISHIQRNVDTTALKEILNDDISAFDRACSVNTLFP